MADAWWESRGEGKCFSSRRRLENIIHDDILSFFSITSASLCPPADKRKPPSYSLTPLRWLTAVVTGYPSLKLLHLLTSRSFPGKESVYVCGCACARARATPTTWHRYMCKMFPSAKSEMLGTETVLFLFLFSLSHQWHLGGRMWS